MHLRKARHAAANSVKERLPAGFISRRERYSRYRYSRLTLVEKEQGTEHTDRHDAAWRGCHLVANLDYTFSSNADLGWCMTRRVGCVRESATSRALRNWESRSSRYVPTPTLYPSKITSSI